MSDTTDGNDIFAAPASSEPASNPGNGDNGIASEPEIVGGKIDPEIARNANSVGTAPVTPAPASSGSVGGGGNNAAGDATGRKRGRHPAGCACDNCTKRREEKAAGGLNDTPEPEPQRGEKRNVRASFIEKSLFGIHTALSKIAAAPELRIEKDEAKQLGEAIAGVLVFHKIKITPKQEAYALLAEVAASIYVPMGATIMLRLDAERKAKAQRDNMTRAAPPTGDNAHDLNPQVMPQHDASEAGPAFDPFSVRMPDGK